MTKPADPEHTGVKMGRRNGELIESFIGLELKKCLKIKTGHVTVLDIS